MPTFTVAVRGTKFRPPEAQEIAAHLGPLEPVTLEPEPFNEHDPNAIKVIARGEFIGYLQKNMAVFLAARLDGETQAYASENIDQWSGLRFIEVTVE